MKHNMKYLVKVYVKSLQLKEKVKPVTVNNFIK